MVSVECGTKIVAEMIRYVTKLITKITQDTSE